MSGQRKITYLALVLAVLTLTACLVAGLGNANARINAAAGWQMELNQKPDKVVLSSDVLEKGNTVVLSDMDLSDAEPKRDFTVSVAVEEGTLSGTLYCTTDSYLTAQCSAPQENFSETEFTITITPTQAAMALTEPVISVVEVQWNEDLWANFQVKLLPVLTEEPSNEEEGGDTSDETTGETEPEIPERDVSYLPHEVDFISGMNAFVSNELLVLNVIVPTACNRLELGFDGATFPAMTRYSLDGGNTYVTLYDPRYLVIEPEEAQAITLLLDMEQAGLAEGEHNLFGYAYYNDQTRGAAIKEVELLQPLQQLDIEGQLVVLNENITLTTSFPQNIGGAIASMSLVRLDGTTDRMPDLSQDANGTVIIQTSGSDGRAKAGAYRLTVKWTYADVLVAQRELEFYVNYSDYVRN